MNVVVRRLMRIERSRDLVRLIEHRLLRPRLWRRVLAPRLRAMDDDEFIRIIGEHGPAGEAVERLHERVRFRFLFHPRNQKEFFLSVLTSAQSYDSIVDEGQAVLENRFETLGSGSVALGWPIDWHCDFKSGVRWPLKPSHTIDMEDLDRPSDVKVPWELSRFHQAWWLGKAYWLTHSEEYAAKFGALIDDWIEHNPAGIGVNWGNAMEAAIRASNWIAGYYFFCDARSLTPAFWLRFFRSLYEHGMFIEHHLEISWRNHNHYLSDLTGLTLLGLLFRDTPAGNRWLACGVKGLTEEMAYQVEPDGVDYEKSIAYHRFVTELFTVPAILCRNNGVAFPPAYWKRLEAMHEFIAAYSRPDGSVPVVGDADDGRLFRTTCADDLNDHRHQLCVGAILFNRGDLRCPGQAFHQDGLWLFGGEGFEQWQRLLGSVDVRVSRAFSDGGFYVMRGEQTHVFIDAGDLGQRGRGGHGHNDLFSFEYWRDGTSVVVDSGTYSYTFDPAARQEFRRTRSHNTATIDGMELAAFASLWEIEADETKPRVLRWSTGPEEDELEAEHLAYAASGVLHRRRFRLMKSTGVLTVADTMNGSGMKTYESSFHLGPDFTVALEEKNKAIATNGNARYIFTAATGEWRVEEGWFSRTYGLRVRNRVLRLVHRAEFPLTVVVTIEPSARS